MMLFCVKTIMIDSHNFELAHLKNEEEKQIWPFGDFLIQYIHNVLSCLVDYCIIC